MKTPYAAKNPSVSAVRPSSRAMITPTTAASPDWTASASAVTAPDASDPSPRGGGTLAHRRGSLRFASRRRHDDRHDLDENDLEALRGEFADVYGGRTVLVTGADGFMGSHLTEALVALGANVHAFVRATSSGALNNIGHLPPRAEGALRRPHRPHLDRLPRPRAAATRPTGRTSSTSAPRRTSASPGTGRTRR